MPGRVGGGGGGERCARLELTEPLPAPLSSLLRLNLDYHNYLTRSRFDIHKLSLRYQFALRCQAPIICNNIPLTVRESLAITNLNRKLKSYFSESLKESNSA